MSLIYLALEIDFEGLRFLAQHLPMLFNAKDLFVY